jgi:hypothetical protein
MTTKIFIATHKEYKMPQSPIYIPVWVGATINPNKCDSFSSDNIGDNISEKNPSYNELSALYWGWKNVDADIKGLAHYRRYIGDKKNIHDYSNLLEEQVIDLLADNDVILTPPKKFYVMDSYTHYIKSQKDIETTHKNDLDTLYKIMGQLYPEYQPALKKVYQSNKVHMLNMFIMKKELFNKYCEWLFSILSEMEKSINRYRVLGAMGEFLLDTYIITNQLKFIEKPIIELERVSFFKKVKNRLSRMLFSKRKK